MVIYGWGMVEIRIKTATAATIINYLNGLIKIDGISLSEKNKVEKMLRHAARAGVLVVRDKEDETTVA